MDTPIRIRYMNNETQEMEDIIYELIKKNQKIEDIIRETIKETDIETIKKKLNHILFLILN
jgi:hypothetical protein